MSGSDDEDEYLKMTFADPETDAKKETLTQKKKRLAREAEARGKPKSKAQLAEEEKAKRDAALSNPNINTTSKGFKMMAALGYKPGSALGKDVPISNNGTDHRIREPIGLDMKEDRGGIGADSEKKRKFREEIAKQIDSEKRQKVDALDFRERQQREREEKRQEGQFYGAMKVAERLEEEDADTAPAAKRTLSSYNILWRGLAKRRMLNDREKRMRYDMDQSLSRLPTYDDPDEDKIDRVALDRKAQLVEVDLELDNEDTELEEFEALPPAEKLTKLVLHLRDRWHYCFWCKYRYENESMEGCPGSTEEDHD